MIEIRQFPDQDYYVTDGTIAIYVFNGTRPGGKWYITGNPFAHELHRWSSAETVIPLEQAVQEIPIPFLHMFHPKDML